ncbi:MAG: hypothetical protein WBX21_11255 [Aestuariivirga sp.]
MLYVDIPSRPEIEKLAASRAEPAVTIYVKTTPLTQEIGASRIALKNLEHQALEQLKAAGVDKRRLWPIEEVINHLVDDDAFWATQANSLALFATPDGLLTYRLANHIPDQVHVSDRFHIQPLLRAVTFPHSAFILVLGENGVKLYQLDADTEPQPVRVPDLPKDAGDALGKTTLNDRSPSGRIHGSEGQNFRLRQYARIVDQALRHVLTGRDRPLIIAATDPLASMFRQANTYPHLAPGEIKGNSERMTPAELAAGARKVLDDLYAAQVAEMKALYAKREAEGRATADVAQAARAATFGAIDTLLFDMDASEAGTISEEDGSVTFGQPGPGTYGIIDEIAGRALATGAKVMAVRKPDLPAGEALSAILRYPI